MKLLLVKNKINKTRYWLYQPNKFKKNIKKHMSIIHRRIMVIIHKKNILHIYMDNPPPPPAPN